MKFQGFNEWERQVVVKEENPVNPNKNSRLHLLDGQSIPPKQATGRHKNHSLSPHICLNEGDLIYILPAAHVDSQ